MKVSASLVGPSGFDRNIFKCTRGKNLAGATKKKSINYLN